MVDFACVINGFENKIATQNKVVENCLSFILIFLFRKIKHKMRKEVFIFKIMTIACRQIFYNSDEYQQMIALRFDVLRKPLNLTFTEEELQKDEHDFLLAAFNGSEIIGCCILKELGNKIFKLRQMAVHERYQQSGTGRQLINFAEEFSKQKNIFSMEMNARKNAVGFYEKLG